MVIKYNTPNSIDELYERHIELYNYLIGEGKISYAIQINEEFRRSLVLAAASHFEAEMQKILISHAKVRSNDRAEIVSLIEIKVIKRQYHTWFNWDDLKDGPFWAMFGKEFKAAREREIRSIPVLLESSRAFLEIGRLRNNIVHRNFADFEVDKTVEEIYSLYNKAKTYVSYCDLQLTHI